MADYTINKARYAKRSMAIRCPSTTGYKTRAARLVEGLKGRYSNREDAYIVSLTKAAKFEKLYAEGWDGRHMTAEIYLPANENKS